MLYPSLLYLVLCRFFWACCSLWYMHHETCRGIFEVLTCPFRDDFPPVHYEACRYVERLHSEEEKVIHAHLGTSEERHYEVNSLVRFLAMLIGRDDDVPHKPCHLVL